MDTGPLVMESEHLHTGRIAFIKGSRAGEANANFKVASILPQPGSTTEYHLMNTARAMGQAFNRVQHMCSIEYLARVFAVLYRRVTIQLSTRLDDGKLGGSAPSSMVNYTTGMLYDYKTITGLGATTLAATLDMAEQAVSTIPNPPVSAAYKTAQGVGKEYRQGIFARDIHPFLRGKCGDTSLVDVQQLAKDAAVYRVARNLGDTYAFAALEGLMAKYGLTDWRPDGVVLSKDHAGPDAMADKEFDNKLGQLFNVVIQGPAICTNFVGDFKLTPMVGDKLFVLIVCDVVFGAIDFPSGGKMAAANVADPTYDQLDAAKEERDGVLNKYDYDAWYAKAVTSFKGKANDFLCNFRLKLSTSAEMINYSGVDVVAAKAKKYDGDGKFPKDARMGLKLGTDMGEYIVGGWCLGTVTDSAASRAALPGVFSQKTDPASYAVNVHVNVHYWSGDRLYRTYCDIEKKSSIGRHVPSDHDAYTLPWSAPASKRANGDFQ